MIEQTITVPNATAQDIYEALLSSEKHTKLIGDTAEISDRVDETFKTFSGYAEGKNVELIPGKKIVQTWRASDWPEDHYSTITFELEGSEEGAVINFTQIDIPEGRVEEYEAGWQNNYWSPMQEFFK